LDCEDNNQTKLIPIAQKSFTMYEDMYKVVDFLNKTLKDKNVMFGLTKNNENNCMIISIYEF